MLPVRAVASAAPAGDESDLARADHSQLIGHSFYVYTRVRTWVALGLAASALFARFGLGLVAIDAARLCQLALAVAVYNLAAWTFFRAYRQPDAPAAPLPWLLAVTYGAVVLDFLALTAAIWLVGGGRSPFTALYVLHVVVCCILLSRRAALALTGVAFSLLCGMVGLEWTGLAVPPLPIGPVSGADPLAGLHAFTLVLVHGLLLWLTALLLLALMRSLRSVEQRIRLANGELQRLSQQRKDFLQVAAHNLRAPLGAVTMLLENMQAGLAGDTSPRQRDWLDRCLRRLGDLDEFMTGISLLSSLESDIARTQFTRVDLAAVAERLVADYADVAAAHRHTLRLDLPDRLPSVVGHERLLQEAVVNYLTNALKYTPDGGHVTLRLQDRSPVVRVEVQDDGPGIAATDQARLFQDFVRLASGPAAPNVKGSGLGLAIVKRIALAHGGRVGVDSEPGRGSTFWLELPAHLE
jgi:signal transduction histidine kinase